MIDFGKTSSNSKIYIKNTGTGTLNWTITKNQPWILTTANVGNTLSGEISELSISVNRVGLKPNIYTGTITILGPQKSINVSIKMEVITGGIAAPVLQIIGTTPSTITLGWTKTTAQNFSNYKIFRSVYSGVDESSQLITTITNQNENNYLDENLNSGTTYYYKLYVYNNDGVGSGSTEVSGTTEAALKNWSIIARSDKYDYYDVFANNEKDVWAVGKLYKDGKNYGYINHWIGNEWKGIYYESFDKIYQIYFNSENEGYALARDRNGYSLYLMIYNGISWTSNLIPVAQGWYDRAEFTVISNNNIYLVDGYSSNIFHYDGNNWSNISIGSEKFNEISSFNSNNIFATNESGDFYKWNGIGWSKEDLLSTGKLKSNLLTISENNIWGTNSLDPIHFDGSKWTIFSTSQRFKDLFYINESLIWGVATRGSIYKFNGNKFESYTSPTNLTLNAVYFINAESGWAVGENGAILRYN